MSIAWADPDGGLLPPLDTLAEKLRQDLRDEGARTERERIEADLGISSLPEDQREEAREAVRAALKSLFPRAEAMDGAEIFFAAGREAMRHEAIKLAEEMIRHYEDCSAEEAADDDLAWMTSPPPALREFIRRLRESV